LQGIDGGQDALALLNVIFQQLQRRDAEERGEDNDADDRGRVRAGQIGKRVLRYKERSAAVR
jgi:hypothetical protein